MDIKAYGFKSVDDLPKFQPPKNSLEPIQTILRTPEQRFEGIDPKDFPYIIRPQYVTSESHGNIRIHYIQDGPMPTESNDVETILLMHGEPSWCYLYRHMMPILAKAGYHVIAPDLVGFGRSDKPARREDYSYERQVNWMSDFVVATKLRNITLFCQDWGGLIGLRLVARFPERFLRVVVSNTGLPVGGTAGAPFRLWASVVSQALPEWSPVIAMGVVKTLSDETLAAYEAPFPSEDYKSASRVFPQLVPASDAHMTVEENKGAWKRVFSHWNRPLLTLFGDSDPVSKGGEKPWIEVVPGAKGQKHHIMEKCGHFLQEDNPVELCDRILDFIRCNPVRQMDVFPSVAKSSKY